MSRPLSRRDFLASGLITVGAALAGPALWRGALALIPTDRPYGPLGVPDANGFALPDGFTSRVVARSGRSIAGYTWHDAPDGGACFEGGDGQDGWIYVSNSEVDDGGGGASAIRFDGSGDVLDAYRIAEGTTRNCSGGPTPWGTWLTCEEFGGGRVWECDPYGRERARPLPALGVFRHEAAAVDPIRKHVFLTEDEPDGRFYRFVPDDYPSLDSGTLQVAVVDRGGTVTWSDVPDPAAERDPTRSQVAAATRFDGGEGTWHDAGSVYFTTKGDDRVWVYDYYDETIRIVHDPSTTGGGTLRGVDNVTGATSGDLFVAEDGGNLEVVIITPRAQIAPLLRLTGDAHKGSELAGPALSPKGDRFYISSQRGYERGVTYEISGPFRTKHVDRLGARGTFPPDEAEEGGPPTGAIVAVTAATVAATSVAARARRRRRAARPDA